MTTQVLSGLLILIGYIEWKIKMNPMENILATIMAVDGATCVLVEQLQYEVVSNT